MRAAVVGTQSRCSRLRENNGCACHRQLAARTAPRHVFDDMPVAVAGGEILAGVHPRRVFTQGLFDDTERLDVIPPVHCADEAQTADAVGDGDLVGRGGSAGRLRQLRLRSPLVRAVCARPRFGRTPWRDPAPGVLRKTPPQTARSAAHRHWQTRPAAGSAVSVPFRPSRACGPPR